MPISMCWNSYLALRLRNNNRKRNLFEVLSFELFSETSQPLVWFLYTGNWPCFPKANTSGKLLPVFIACQKEVENLLRNWELLKVILFHTSPFFLYIVLEQFKKMHVQKVKEQEKAYNKQVRVYHSFISLFLINHCTPIHASLPAPASSRVGGGGAEGYFWKFLVWGCNPVIQILTLFQTTDSHFPHPFSDLGWVVQSVVKITQG